MKLLLDTHVLLWWWTDDKQLSKTAIEEFHQLIEVDGFEHLPINWQHSMLAEAYTHEHQDPFDRMLAAQSEVENARLVTCDAAFITFNTQVFW